MKKIVFCIIIGIILLSHLVATSGEKPVNKDFDEKLQRVIEKQSHIKSFTARFLQQKTSPLLLKPISSTGSIYLKRPGKILFVYDEPYPSKMAINGNKFVN